MSLLHAIALTQIHGIGPATARKIVEQVDDLSLLFEHSHELPELLPEANEQLLSLLNNTEPALQRAREELDFIEKKNMRCIMLGDKDYPVRLQDCDDAPLMLYFCGNTDLNAKHIVSIVGTRHATAYGKDLCSHFIEDLHALDPSMLIVSGLAYGIDICAHREALRQGLPTVGVVAHGLDMIYPRLHRQTAVEMTHHGGLLTEYPTHTTIEKGNFVQRNRIVAGLADATVVVESAERGGSLITANIANSYGREVYAFPGRTNDEYSKGCNRIIYNNLAHSIRSAQDLFELMGWQAVSSTKQPVQQELFVKLAPEEQKIIDCLSGSDEGKTTSEIVAESGMSFSAVSIALFELESKGMVDFIGGGRYRKIR